MGKIKIKREELESIYYLRKELAMWEERLKELEADISLSAIASDGMPHASTTGSPTERKAIKLMETKKIVDGKAAEIKLTIANIEKYILSIKDSEMRQIIEYRCTMCMKWEEIGERLNYDRTTIAKKYNIFIKEQFPQFPRRKQ